MLWVTKMMAGRLSALLYLLSGGMSLLALVALPTPPRAQPDALLAVAAVTLLSGAELAEPALFSALHYHAVILPGSTVDPLDPLGELRALTRE